MLTHGEPGSAAILNSDLMNAYYASQFPEHRIKGAYLESLPIKVPGPGDRIGDGLVKRTCTLSQDFMEVGSTRDREMAKAELEILLRQLYGLGPLSPEYSKQIVLEQEGGMPQPSSVDD